MHSRRLHLNLLPDPDEFWIGERWPATSGFDRGSVVGRDHSQTFTGKTMLMAAVEVVVGSATKGPPSTGESSRRSSPMCLMPLPQRSPRPWCRVGGDRCQLSAVPDGGVEPRCRRGRCGGVADTRICWPILIRFEFGQSVGRDEGVHTGAITFRDAAMSHHETTWSWRCGGGWPGTH